MLFKSLITSETLKAISWERGYGYINKKGQEVIPLIYEMGNSFRERRATVELNGKWGAIDKRGDTMIDFQYDALSDCINGRYLFAADRRLGILDKKGKVLVISEQRDEIDEN